MANWGIKKGPRDFRRPRLLRTPVKKILIVCEGKKTEPNYFNGLRSSMRLSTLEIEIADNDKGTDPVSVVEKAKELFRKSSGDPYDAVFCVFDKDSHTTFTQAISMIDDLKKARISKPFYAIDSIPCFEYWVLLHFACIRKAFLSAGRVSPCDNVEREVLIHFPKYDKGMKHLFGVLQPSIAIAFNNAREANKAAELVSDKNPSTRIPLIFERLQNFSPRDFSRLFRIDPNSFTNQK